MKHSLVLYALICMLSATTIAHAAPITQYNMTFTIERIDIHDSESGSLNDSLVEGDQFKINFTIDGGAVDDNPTPGHGTFTSPTLGWKISALPGNTGGWDPSSGYFSNATIKTYDLEAGGIAPQDAVTVSGLMGDGFPPAGDFSVDAFQFALTAPSGVDRLNDTGSGQTLDEIAIGGPLDLTLFNDKTAFDNVFQAMFYLQDKKVVVWGDLSDVNDTPIPTALPLLGSALGLLGFARWRRHLNK